MKLLYENIDQDEEPISREALNELIEMHMVVFLMSLKRFFRDGEKKEEASEYYKRHIRMLHYGICAYRSDRRKRSSGKGWKKKAMRETEHADRKKKRIRRRDQKATDYKKKMEEP
ncbi:MAG: hypothetical protein V8S93_10355 [Lachnospiraceae bacterium]